MTRVNVEKDHETVRRLACLGAERLSQGAFRDSPQLVVNGAAYLESPQDEIGPWRVQANCRNTPRERVDDRRTPGSQYH